MHRFVFQMELSHQTEAKGKESKLEAERVVMQWIVSGNIPTTVSKKGKAIGQTSLEFVSILNGLKTRYFTEKEIDEMINVLKEKTVGEIKRNVKS